MQEPWRTLLPAYKSRTSTASHYLPQIILPISLFLASRTATTAIYVWLSVN
jgi:hypothetical protein